MRNSHCHLIAWPNRSRNRFLLSDIQSHWQRYQTDKSEHWECFYVCVSVCACGLLSLQHGRLWTSRHLCDCLEMRERQIEVLQYSLQFLPFCWRWAQMWAIHYKTTKRKKQKWIYEMESVKVLSKICSGGIPCVEWYANPDLYRIIFNCM